MMSACGLVIVGILLFFSFTWLINNSEARPITSNEPDVSAPDIPLTQKQEQQMEQKEAGKWVEDWWNLDTTQARIDAYSHKYDTIECKKQIEKYNKRLIKKPNSTYFNLKLKYWTDKCRNKTL